MLTCPVLQFGLEAGDRPLDGHQTLHPTDQTLQRYGLGKLDDASAESVNEHLESCADLPAPGRRDVVR